MKKNDDAIYGIDPRTRSVGTITIKNCVFVDNTDEAFVIKDSEGKTVIMPCFVVI